MIAGQIGDVLYSGFTGVFFACFDPDLCQWLVTDPDVMAYRAVVFNFTDQLTILIIEIIEYRGSAVLMQRLLDSLALGVVVIVGDQPALFINLP